MGGNQYPPIYYWNLKEMEKNIHMFLSGNVIFKIGNKYIYVKPQSARDKAFADFFAQEQYDDVLLDGIWTQKEAENYLIEMGFWSKEEDDRIDRIKENIENMKVDYFNNFFSLDAKKYIKLNIEKQEKKITDLTYKKYYLYDKTCDYLRLYSFNIYNLQRNAFLKNGTPAYLVFSMHSLYNKYNSAITELNSNARKISKTEEWKQKWFNLKTRCFDNKSSSFTDFQLSIISWSRYYDGIMKGYEKPGDNIIEDDIALDGWAIIEKRKRIEEEKKRSSEKILPEKMQNAGEIFIPAGNAQRAQDIMNLNNEYAKKKIRMLKSDLNKDKVVNESDLTSTRQELQMQAIKMQKERRR